MLRRSSRRPSGPAICAFNSSSGPTHCALAVSKTSTSEICEAVPLRRPMRPSGPAPCTLKARSITRPRRQSKASSGPRGLAAYIRAPARFRGNRQGARRHPTSRLRLRKDGAYIMQTVRKLGGLDGNVDCACGSALFSGFGLQSRRWPLGRHGEASMAPFATKQGDLGPSQAATAAIILSMPRMLSARRKL